MLPCGWQADVRGGMPRCAAGKMEDSHVPCSNKRLPHSCHTAEAHPPCPHSPTEVNTSLKMGAETWLERWLRPCSHSGRRWQVSAKLELAGSTSLWPCSWHAGALDQPFQ